MIESPRAHDQPQRVLIVKPSALGDVVTALPLLRGLWRTFPNVHISWLLSDHCAALVRHDSQLDQVIPFERRKLSRAWRSPSAARAMVRLLAKLRAEKFDWAIDLQGLLRSGILTAATRAPLRAGFADAREGAQAFYTDRVTTGSTHTVDRNIELAKQLGIDARPEDMRLEVSAPGREFVEAFRRHGNVEPGGFLVCVPPTTWPTKVYPVRHWRKVVTALSKLLPVVLTGAASDRGLCRQVAEGLTPGVSDLAGKTTVDEMVALIAASAGVVCCDSAAQFIAPAVGVDCLTLIGPTRVERTGPYGRGRAIVADVPCQGCLKRRCGHVTCMQLIDPGEVISAAEAMLNGRAV